MKYRPMTRAERAQLAMMLEVCAGPKPGNVDRCHDYEDTWLEHFLASTIFVYPAFEKAERGEGSVGDLIREAVTLSAFHGGGNTHFGAFILLVPLIMGGDAGGAWEIVRRTTVEDAIAFYEAFGMTKVRMLESDELDVNDPATIRTIRNESLTLYDIMEHSAERDMVAREWMDGFALSQRASRYIRGAGSGRGAIPQAFLRLLAEEIDTFIVKKHGAEIALITRDYAREVCEGKRDLAAFDEYLVREGINPGSIADIIIAGIYLALGEGWQWDS